MCKKIPRGFVLREMRMEPTTKERLMFMSTRLAFVALFCVVVAVPAAAQVSVRAGVYTVLVSGALHHGLPGSRIFSKRRADSNARDRRLGCA